MAKKRMIIKIDISGCKNMKEQAKILEFIEQGKLKISVFTTKK